MKEKNPDTLKRAIGQLPGYVPPSELWERIADQLPTPHPRRRIPLAWAAALAFLISLGIWMGWRSHTYQTHSVTLEAEQKLSPDLELEDAVPHIVTDSNGGDTSLDSVLRLP